MEPLIKGPAGLEYLKKAFANRYGPPTDAHTSLPLTMQWLSSVHSSAEQEWDEYKDSVSSLTVNNERLYQGLPPTTLRTGGSIPMASRLGSPSSKGLISDITGLCIFFLKLKNRGCLIKFLKLFLCNFILIRWWTTGMQGRKGWFVSAGGSVKAGEWDWGPDAGNSAWNS